MLGLQVVVLTDLLTSSAQIYYQYLDDNGLGVEKIRVRESYFEGQKLFVFLAQKLFSTDSLLLRCGEREFYVSDEDGIILLSYSEQNLLLVLEFGIDTQGFEDFELLSDLKFLVKNTERFFAAHSIHLPNTSPCAITKEELSIQDLSEEQRRAVGVIFSSPLSYIWGPPGSGKTQKVLFQALLLLMQKGKKAALIAPTNNALELALKSLIKQSDYLGLDRNLFLRLGVPSAEFLALYPECCDGTVVDKKKLSLFNFGGFKERLEGAGVVAMTLDGFIKRYEGLKTTFDHLFLDECGFAPLIKAAALCANPAPLTLLGDHKQLMPVCEMPQKELIQQPKAKLWNLSALFLEGLFGMGEAVCVQKNLSFKATKVAILKTSYRYGDNLAQILDAFLYRNGLRGKSKESGIFVLDCGDAMVEGLRGELHPSHNNAKEVAAIKRELYSFGRDYAIITPFVKQRQLLIQNGVSYERVFTIHSSQGQEFDSVIFSPVTLHYHLTDSHNPLALQALNVAISRVKKNLILVCDVAFWSKHSEQFLSQLIQSAQIWKA